MTIKKQKVRGKFATIPNSLLHRPDLSWAAKGLICYLISKPSNWKGRKSDIKAHCPPMTEYAYKKIIGELIKKEFIVIRYIPNPCGKGVLGSYYELGIIPEIEYVDAEETNESAND
jgi:hypothetical protein